MTNSLNTRAADEYTVGVRTAVADGVAAHGESAPGVAVRGVAAPRIAARSDALKFRRRGNTLVELIVALPIAAMISTVAVALLLDTQKLARRLDSSTEIARELRQAGAVLTSEIRPLSAGDVVAWTDTSLDFHGLAGSGIVCATPAANIIDLLPLNGSDALRTSWFAAPQNGDDVYTVSADSAIVPHDGNWRVSSLAAYATAGSSQCTTRTLMSLGLSSTSNVVRLTLSAGLATRASVGSPVRIARRTRYSLYKASDALWYLGRKTFNGIVWTTIQPVAGPFDKPIEHGLLIQVRDSANNVLPAGSPRTPRSVALMLRGSSPWLRAAGQPGARDSMLVHVALRGQMSVSVP
ncbi:MAG: hypothetical protein ABJB74_18305 [Gemmatimonas sp.]